MNNNQTIHYCANNKEWQKLRKTTAHFDFGAVCGNGIFYKGTSSRDWSKVNCRKCLKMKRKVEK